MTRHRVTLSDAFAPIAVTRRSGVDESVHFGALVALGPSGAIEFSVGDPTVRLYPRSSNKPMQAVGMVRAGLRLPPELLALVCASHDGTPAHLAGVKAILDSAGLDESALGNVADLPLDPAAAETILRAGGGRTPLQMNCSGKHSGMLATCAINHWPHDLSYLEADHPLQLAITGTLAELVGEEPAHIGVDGCGAPAHVVSLIGLARGLRSIATRVDDPSCRVVVEAMTTEPVMVGGERRDVTRLMRTLPGVIAKDGAEGVMAVAMPDGRALAFKIADGANRARPPVMLAALERLGVDVSALAPQVTQPILGRGQPVGEVRAVLT